MKLFRTLTIPSIIIACALAFTACGGDDPEPDPTPDRGESIEIPVPESLTFMTADDDNPLAGSIIPNVRYQIAVFPDDKTFDVTILGLSTAATSGGSPVVLSSLPYMTLPDGTLKADVTNIIADGDIMRFRKLSLHCPAPGATTSPDGNIFSLEMETWAKDEITVIPTTIICRGITEVALPGTDTFRSADTFYTITIAPDGQTADLIVSNARFAQNMPSVGDMLFASLAVTFEDGGYELKSTSLIPSIGGVPYPAFAITDLDIDVDLSSDADIEFSCGALGRSYRVEADDLTLTIPDLYDSK